MSWQVSEERFRWFEGRAEYDGMHVLLRLSYDHMVVKSETYLALQQA